VKVFTPLNGEPDAKAVAQLKQCLADDRAIEGALMADHHLGYSMPIGGVIAYQDAISPSGVGFDIGCGNKAVRTDLTVDDIDETLPNIMLEIQRTVSFGLGRTNDTPVDHELFDRHAATLRELDSLYGPRCTGPGQQLSQRARAQLGTVGSGNHYVDLLADEDGFVWVANHFGSRGLGHTIATGFLNLAVGNEFRGRGAEREEPTVFNTHTDLGQFYIEAMKLAGDYAYAGRDYVIDQVLRILGADCDVAVHNHHNYAWLENGAWVVRKGATPLTRQLAYIGGSMGEGAVIVRGASNVEDNISMGNTSVNAVADIGAIGSAPHGAGRVMSRTKAAGKFKNVRIDGRKRRVRDASTGLVDWPAVQQELAERGIIVLGSGADEAPEVYKSLPDVIAAHENIEVMRASRRSGFDSQAVHSKGRLAQLGRAVVLHTTRRGFESLTAHFGR
jgi:tRNA-splicing ligase RtcB (3'-phosphate/5'-hydroxy nucleic acid ligase)